MYQNTPFKNYAQIQDGLRRKAILLRIARGKYSTLLQRFGQGRISVVLAFLLQLLLPAAVVIGWYLYCGDPSTLAAVLVYLLLPFLFPLGQLLSGFMTALGLFGLIWHWPAWCVALLLPALLSYLGSWIWQQSILLLVCRQVLHDKGVFEELWLQGLIALQDKEGVYQYSASGEK